MATLTITNYTHKAAKAIINRMYEADNSSAIQNLGLAMVGKSICAEAKATDNGYEIIVTSSVFEENTLKGLVEEGLNRL